MKVLEQHKHDNAGKKKKTDSNKNKNNKNDTDHDNSNTPEQTPELKRNTPERVESGWGVSRERAKESLSVDNNQPNSDTQWALLFPDLHRRPSIQEGYRTND